MVNTIQQSLSDSHNLPHKNNLTVPATADILDNIPTAQVLPPLYRHFGGLKVFAGPCVLVSCFEDNSKVKALLEGPGLCSKTGFSQVLVVNGGGSLHCALLGDMIAQKAVSQQWAGVIINGCVRDTAILAKLNLGVLALAATPRKSIRQDQGSVNPASFNMHNIAMEPGFFVYADTDGVVVLPKAFQAN